MTSLLKLNKDINHHQCICLVVTPRKLCLKFSEAFVNLLFSSSI